MSGHLSQRSNTELSSLRQPNETEKPTLDQVSSPKLVNKGNDLIKEFVDVDTIISDRS